MADAMLAAMASPVKRKRVVHNSADDPESDIESTDAAENLSKRKKARFQPSDDTDDDGTNYALSTAASVADSHTATAPFAESTTPLTEASSVRSKSKPRPKKYYCTFPDCDKAFDRPVRLQTHINSHTGTRPHVCPEDDCDKSFFKSEHLNRHMREKHSEKSFVCEHKVHDDISGEMVACGKKFESANKLKRHVAMHEDKEETTCTWDGCGKVFRKQETLQRHIKKDHLDEDSWMCSRPLPEGGICGQSFPTPGQLRGHEARKHEAPKYICEVCTNAMMMPSEMQLPVHNDLDPEFLPTPADLVPKGGVLEATALGELSLEDVAEPAQLQYPGGVIGFATYHDLQRHNKVAHPPICNECGKRCRSGKDLAAHMDIMHPPPDAPATDLPQPEKRFLCPYDGCPRSVAGNGFAKKGNMDVHVKSMHTKEKSFICGEYDLSGSKRVEGWNGKGCGMAMQTKQSLIGHIRTQHMGVPAALGARTGLKDKDRTRAILPKKAKSVKNEDAMDVDADDDVLQPAVPNAAISMLTGSGYELRPLGCLAANGPFPCQMRFKNDYELSSHLELTHGWNVDDINDALEEGAQAVAGAKQNNWDASFRRDLEMQLGGNNSGPLDPQLQSMSA